MGVLLGAHGTPILAGRILVLSVSAFALLGCPQVLDDDFSYSNTEAEETRGCGGTRLNLGDQSGADASSVNTASGGGGKTTSTVSTGGSGGTGGGGAANAQPDAEPDAGDDATGGPDAGDLDAGELDASDADLDSGVPGCIAGDEVCNGLDDDCDDDVDEDDVCPAGCVGFTIENDVYVFCGTALAVADARDQCEEFEMGLVSIESSAENLALVDRVAPLHEELAEPNAEQAAFWTAGTDAESEGDWRWGSAGDPFWQGDDAGQPVDGAYSNWGPGRPNEANAGGEDCILVYVADGADGDSGEWNDIACSKGFSFVCEP